MPRQPNGGLQGITVPSPTKCCRDRWPSACENADSRHLRHKGQNQAPDTTVNPKWSRDLPRGLKPQTLSRERQCPFPAPRAQTSQVQPRRRQGHGKSSNWAPTDFTNPLVSKDTPDQRKHEAQTGRKQHKSHVQQKTCVRETHTTPPSEHRQPVRNQPDIETDLRREDMCAADKPGKNVQGQQARGKGYWELQ